MAVLVTSKFEDDSIKSKGAIVLTTFCFVTSLWENFSSLKSEYFQKELSDLARDLMPVLVTAI